MDDDQLLSNEALSLVNVPQPEDDLQAFEEFCLTVDGYDGERHSIDELLELARRVEIAGLETASLDDLRTAAFIRQRELRWTTHGDDAADAPLIRSIRALVGEIRRRVAERAEIGS